MKKTYINPAMEVIKVHTQQMLAASTDMNLKGGTASEWGARGSDLDDDF